MTSKIGVLVALMHAICWLREVLSVFAPALDSDLLKAVEGTGTQST